jgi:thiamine-monophosphate kinase
MSDKRDSASRSGLATGRSSASGTVRETGEFALIELIAAQLGQRSDVLIGPGDDAAVVQVGESRVVASVDVYVQGVHFRTDWSTAIDVGHRVAAAAMADIVAMGARPSALLVGLAAPASLEVPWAIDFAKGLGEEATQAEASVVGGDLSRGEVLTVSVTALGALGGRPVTRGGAQVGDVVAMHGRLGWAAAGLAVLQRGFRSPRAVVDAHRRPSVDYRAGLSAAEAGATAMCDVSDGLLADLGHVARASGVGIDLESAALVVAQPLHDVGAALTTNPLEWVLGGGDDHALVATFPMGAAIPEGWTVIGRVNEGEDVLVDHAEWNGPKGHTHFN